MSLPGPLRRCAARLRAMAPTKYPVRIRLVDEVPGDLWGDCDLLGRGKTKYFLIRLTRPQTRREQSLLGIVLCHEYAHALAWGLDGDEAHGDHWGLACALVERIENTRA